MLLCSATDASLGSPVVKVTATDVDLETTLTYSIERGNNNNTFSVDRRSGQLFVARRLDAGTVSSYRLSLQVSNSIALLHNYSKHYMCANVIYKSIINRSLKTPVF